MSPPRPCHLLEVLRAVAKRLDGVGKLSRLNDGRLLLKCLTSSGGCSTGHDEANSDAAWNNIRDRIVTVFGEDLIDWSNAKRLKMSRSVYI